MIGSVYDYYLTTYASKPATRSDTHKKSELRNIYNTIVKISKKSPLYKVDVSENIQRYAIDLKENARFIKSKTDLFFNDSDNGIRKKLISSDEDVLSINYMGIPESEQNDSILSYEFQVDALAKPQVNTGNFLKSNGTSISTGNHAFEVDIGDYSYEFQFSVQPEDTNKSVQEKLARLINRSDIGLTAQVITNDANKSALKLTSDKTGTAFNGTIFSVINTHEQLDDNTIDRLGLNNVSQMSSNAEFRINGVNRTSASNTFTINKNLEVTLKGISREDNPSHIKYQDDIISIIDSIKGMADSYKNIVDLANKTTSESAQTHSLQKEIRRMTERYKNDLESIGLNITEEGYLNFDESLILQSAGEGTISESLNHLREFKNGLAAKADDISINPMKYVKKVMISYPNPKKSFANPYVTSIYSGMMYNGYI